MRKTFIKAVGLLLCLAFCLLLLPACQKSDPLAQNGFTALTVNAKKNQVNASVTLDAHTLQAHKGETAFLYELMPGERISDLSNRDPLDQAKIGTNMSFQFSLTDGDRTRLYSTFTVIFEDGTALLSEGYAIENPQALASNTSSFPWVNSPKGLYPSKVSSAAELGTSHVMYQLAFSDFFNGEDNSATFTFNGTAFTYAPSALAELDKQICEASDAGLQVSLALTPDSIPSKAHAVALLDFIAARYAGGENGTVSAFFLDIPAEMSASDASILCRLANQALRARFANGRIYIIAPTSTLTETKVFFSDLQLSVAASGAPDWGAAVRPALTDTAWDTEEAYEGPLTLQELSELSTYLFSAARNGRASYLAVCDLAFSAADEEKQAASFAYAYRTALAAKANLIFYASHMEDEAGIYTALGEERPLTSVFSDIDTGLSEQDELLCSTTIGNAWTNLSQTKLTRRLTSGAASIGTGGFEENILFDFTTGDTYGFSGVESATDPTCRNSAVFSAPVLYTWLDPSNTSSSGVRKILENGSSLRSALSVSATLLTQAPDAATCRVRLRLDGTAEDGTLLTHESETDIKNGAWQTVTFQISSFVADADLSKPCILTLTVEPDQATDEEYVLWVGGFNVRQPENDMGAWLPLSLILSGALIGFICVFVIYHISSKKKNRRTANRRG